MHCGTRLAEVCGQCGALRAPGTASCPECGAATAAGGAGERTAGRPYTPKHLAERILSSRTALEGERKQVTVLFVDVKDSLALSDEVGPDVWHEVLEAFFGVLAEDIHRFEGTINQYTGDGIMALFGAPIAHEDHAQRACHAALRLRSKLADFAERARRDWGIPFQTRMGLNSGPVVVGRIGDDLRMDYTAQGLTVGLASRMEQLCEPGAVYASHNTVRLVRGFFDFADLGERDIKGAGRLSVYRLERLGHMKTRLQAAAIHGLSPFVDRAEEWQRLDEALELALQGKGQVFGVVGEPGFGKSRLCREFTERCKLRDVAVYAVHCPAHAQNMPYSGLLELLLGYLGVGRDEEPASMRARIRASAERQLDMDTADVLPIVYELLDVADRNASSPPMDPEARQRHLFDLLRAMVRSGGTKVILVDDAQWLDPVSDTFMAELAAAVPGTHSLLLVNCRPEYRAPWMTASHCAQMELGPLGADASTDLLTELLGSDSSVQELTRLMLERTQGNPFFIEETLKSLTETSVLQGQPGSFCLGQSPGVLAVPETVDSVVAARIDRLSEQDKRLLQAASIMGREFSPQLLQKVTAAPCEELDRRLAVLFQNQFLQVAPKGDDFEYAFSHPLTQEVAYKSQLVQNRRRLHARVAQALSEQQASGSALQDSLTAYHWECAGEDLEAAKCLARAARRSGYADPAQSLRHWQKVAELTSGLSSELQEAERLELTSCLQLLNLGWRQGLSLHEAEQLFARSRELIPRVGISSMNATLHASYGRILAFAKDTDAYLEQVDKALRLASEENDTKQVTLMESVMSHALCHAGWLRKGLALCDAALERLGRDPLQRIRGLAFSPYLWLLVLRGQTLTLMGRLQEAERSLLEAQRSASELGEVDLLIAPRYLYVDLCWHRGDGAAAVAPAVEAQEIGEKLGNTISLVMANIARGLERLLNGQPQEAHDHFVRALDMASERGAGLELEARMLNHLAEAHLQLGHVEQAADIAQRALKVARQRKNRVVEAQTSLLLARVLLRTTGERAVPDATENLTAAEKLVQQTGADLLSPFLQVAWSEVAGVLGDVARQRRAREEAQRLFAEMGAVRRLEGSGPGPHLEL